MSNVYGRIYCITSPSGKQYIGQTVATLERRWKQHCRPSHSCRALTAAIKKYGAENFKIELLATAKSQDELNSLEILFIETLGSRSPGGYNLRSGGQRGAMHAETIEKMRATWMRPGEKESRGAKIKAALSKPEVKAKQSAGISAAAATPEGKAKRSRASRDAKASPEVRARIGAKLSATLAKPDARQRHIDARVKVLARPGVREAISAKMRALWQDPTFRAAQMLKRYGKVSCETA